MRQTPAIARQLLRKLLPEPLVIEPIPGRVQASRGRAAWAAILTGVLHSACLVVPPGSPAEADEARVLPFAVTWRAAFKIGGDLAG